MDLLLGLLLLFVAYDCWFNWEGQWKRAHFLTVKNGEPTEFYRIGAKITGMICGILGAVITVDTLYRYWQML